MKAARPVRRGADGKVLRATGATRRRPTLHTPNGTAVTNLRLATDRYRRDAEDATDWHTVIVWGKTAEAVNQYVTKGQRLYVAGRLVQNTWENEDGQRRHRTEVHTQEVVFLDSNGNGNGNGAGDDGGEDSPF